RIENLSRACSVLKQINNVDNVTRDRIDEDPPTVTRLLGSDYCLPCQEVLTFLWANPRTFSLVYMAGDRTQEPFAMIRPPGRFRRVILDSMILINNQLRLTNLMRLVDGKQALDELPRLFSLDLDFLWIQILWNVIVVVVIN